VLQQKKSSEKREAIRIWIDRIYQFICGRRELFTALLLQVPFVYQIPSLKNLATMILDMALKGNENFAGIAQSVNQTEKRYFISAATAGVILNIALMPPENINVDFVLGELADKLVIWSSPE